jgi:hypothetical protein
MNLKIYHVLSEVLQHDADIAKNNPNPVPDFLFSPYGVSHLYSFQ